MRYWHKLSKSDRRDIIEIESVKRNLPAIAVEKDWWVTMILKSLLQTSCGKSLIFKGGTSLSKGWGLIERFSEDIDLAIRREGDMALSSTSKNQREKLRKKARNYIHNVLSKELSEVLSSLGVEGFAIENITSIRDSDNIYHAIDSDKDPTVINIHYESVVEETSDYMPSCVKIEISCMSMHEPTKLIPISSMIGQSFPDVDGDSIVEIATVLPSRTFLEKIFLLNEEFRKDKPRHIRMSRHLYDLERLMDTDFGKSALSDLNLYNEIAEHRKVFYALNYFDYGLHSPSMVSIIPPETVIKLWEHDYKELCRSFVYGHTIPFAKLIERMQELEKRIRLTSAT